MKTTHNAWIHAFAFACAAFLGFYLQITNSEWALIVLAGAFVLASEAFNTAIEIDMDLTSPEFHPYARDTKDVAAGAVLIASIVAAIIGAIVFVPYFL
jgi:diacylglycerol kinase (ATP)